MVTPESNPIAERPELRVSALPPLPRFQPKQFGGQVGFGEAMTRLDAVSPEMSSRVAHEASLVHFAAGKVSVPTVPLGATPPQFEPRLQSPPPVPLQVKSVAVATDAVAHIV